DDDGRPLISVFMEKPSKKDYPDYYEIIANPIDMKTIDSNIKADKYVNEESLISDFRLMFSNCKHYNEEGSQIYQDAQTLETILNNKIQEMGLNLCETPKMRIPIKRGDCSLENYGSSPKSGIFRFGADVIFAG
ncbi:Protein polybromo-1, partial [Araneus ventricosus]